MNDASPYRYGKADAESVRQCIRIAAEAFHEELSHQEQWLKMTGHDNYRLLLEGDEALASLHFLDDAQLFAGKQVRSWALDNVATAPNHRNRGAIMETVQKAIDRGDALTPELLMQLGAAVNPRMRDLRRGIVFLALGIAGLLCSLFFDIEQVVNGIRAGSVFPLMLGLGFLLVWKLNRD